REKTRPSALIPRGFTSILLMHLLTFFTASTFGATSGLVAWGGNSAGQTNIPAGLSNVLTIAAGYSHNLALKREGTVTAWGDNHNGQTNVPPGVTNVIAIAAGAFHSLALRADGGVAAWGHNGYGQTVVP